MRYSDFWGSFVEKELTFYDVANRKYKKKGYLHFDNRIWFPEFKDAFKKLILNSENVARHSFFPFLKVILKTKRIRYNAKSHSRQVTYKERPISYAAHLDALIYSFYSSVLTDKYEQFLLDNNLGNYVLAYRSLDLCNIDFADEVFKYIEQKKSCVAIALDIKGFFDNLDHEILKRCWLKVINHNEAKKISSLEKDQYRVFRSLTSFAYVEKTDLLEVLKLSENKVSSLNLPRYCDINEFRDKVRGKKPSIIKRNSDGCGIPQGSPISAVLSNIYMLEYDEAIGRLSERMDFCYRRYCDDIIVVCKPEDAEEIKAQLYLEIAKHKLTIQPEKEDIVIFKPFKNGFRGFRVGPESIFKNLQYLGFDFNGSDRYIRSSSLSRYHRRMKAGARETVKRAYGRRAKGNNIFKRKLYDRFTHLGGRNFTTYAYRAASIMQSSTIKKQISRHVDQVKDTLDAKTEKLFGRLRSMGRIVPRKKQ